MDPHPLSLKYPLLSDAEFAAFKADVAANGQRNPVWEYEGKILDGRNRHRACVELGVAPKVERFAGTPEQAAAFVDSQNLHRRHLTAEFRKERAVEMSREGKSTRTIARELKVDQSTIVRDLASPGDAIASPGDAELETPEEEPADTRPEEPMTGTSESRRNLTPEIIRLAEAGRTAPEIAPLIGRDVGHVRKVVKKARESGTLPPVPTVTGRDGKQYPAAGGKPAAATAANGKPRLHEPDAAKTPERELGVGMIKANEVIRTLRSIPKDDRFRSKGLQAVLDWIKLNK